MIIVNSQKSLILGIVENVQLKIIDVLISINIYIIDLIKEELLIGLNQFFRYKANLILTEGKLKFQVQERKFEIKIINIILSNTKV